MYPELLTRHDLKTFLPPIGGMTVYIVRFLPLGSCLAEMRVLISCSVSVHLSLAPCRTSRTRRRSSHSACTTSATARTSSEATSARADLTSSSESRRRSNAPNEEESESSSTSARRVALWERCASSALLSFVLLRLPDSVFFLPRLPSTWCTTHASVGVTTRRNTLSARSSSPESKVRCPFSPPVPILY